MEQAALEFGSASFFLALLQIIWINILLSGDNAIVIALACRNLPDRQRQQGVFWGVLAAVVLRIGLTAFAVSLLQFPTLKLIGGLLLIYIGVQLVLPQQEDEGGQNIVGKDRLFDAIKTILIADLAMSVDNVIGVAGAARGDFSLLVFGLGLSIPLVIWGSKVVLLLIHRFSWIVTAGGGLLGYLAGEMIQTDSLLESFWSDELGWAGHELAWAGLILVVVLGKWLGARQPRQRAAEQATEQATHALAPSDSTH